MLLLNNLRILYRSVIPLLHGISLKVDDGQVVALLGANGAGKSITLKAISGLIRSELGDVNLFGTIEYGGQRLDRKLPEEIVKMGIVQVEEGHKVLDELTVKENLLVGGHICGNRAEIKERLDLVYEYFIELRELQRKQAGYLSGGEQQMLVIARAMMAQPKVMLLDEISFGLAPLLIWRIIEIIKKINIERKTSILMAEQNVRAAFRIAQFIYLLDNGKVILEGSTEKLKNEENIEQFFLGFKRSTHLRKKLDVDS